MVVPGFLVSLLTFPGVVVHEFAHRTSCDAFDVPVAEVAYFRLGNPAGYVVHGEPTTYRQAFAISVAPFVVNTAVALALFGVVASLWRRPDAVGIATEELGVAGWLLLWVGLSAGMHAFPSRGDAKQIWRRSLAEWRSSPLVLLGMPVVVLVYAANLLSVVWFDAIYALGLLAFVLLLLGTLPG